MEVNDEKHQICVSRSWDYQHIPCSGRKDFFTGQGTVGARQYHVPAAHHDDAVIYPDFSFPLWR
jgi:hypothetical protein